MKKNNINKKKIILILIIIIVIYPTIVFGKYTYNEAVDLFLTSRGFYFESELLSVNNKEYTYSSWDGNGTTSIPINLYSMKNSLQDSNYNNMINLLDDVKNFKDYKSFIEAYNLKFELQRTDYDIQYSISCEISQNSKIECALDNIFSKTEKNDGVIYKETNSASENIYIRAKSGETLEEGDTATINVVAIGTGVKSSDGSGYDAKYKKKLLGKIIVRVSGINPTYSIEDASGNPYLILTLTNTEPNDVYANLSWNADLVKIDSNNNEYKVAKVNAVNSVTTTTINTLTNNSLVQSTSQFINSFQTTLGEYSSTQIKFYKTDISQDYSYPSNNTSVINVQFTEN